MARKSWPQKPVDDLRHTRMDSPLGPILLAADESGLRVISFLSGTKPVRPAYGWIKESGPFREAVAQLRAYFARELQLFTLPLSPLGTPFQHLVWDGLRNIPYGTTLSYGELARRIGHPGSARAVGAANGRNPLPIVVPCHRVIGQSGQLTGYAGGLPIKQALLELEGISQPVQETLPLMFPSG